ncbi:MAG: UDP-3-O-(3-hydroxymyristoyl)glucosamine N-acyltransferase [Marinobacterium sp.]|nr:UDP-3-O-(3-hydroxymyristoyl)glucosamine N-acyltransferase [Marinobacterium sp.]
MTERAFTLQQIAEQTGGQVDGDPQYRVTGLATLESAEAGQLSLYTGSRYLQQLVDSTAGAVLINAEERAQASCHAVIVDDPYAAYARLTHLFDRNSGLAAGIHPSAVIAESASVSETAQICANVVIGENSVIADDCYIGANTVVGERCQLGSGCRLHANVTLYNDVRLGERVIIHSSAVLGADGFGFAPWKESWFKIAQLGGVVVGDDVEIGACTTIDRGALDNTLIDNGVKLDNQIMVGHNVEIGEHSAIAACTGIAGSTRIGKHVRIAGGAGIAGHISIADHSYISGMAMVTGSVRKAGSYSSGTALEPTATWRRNVVRFRQLDSLAGRVKELEQKIKEIEGHS